MKSLAKLLIVWPADKTRRGCSVPIGTLDIDLVIADADVDSTELVIGPGAAGVLCGGVTVGRAGAELVDPGARSTRDPLSRWAVSPLVRTLCRIAVAFKAEFSRLENSRHRPQSNRTLWAPEGVLLEEALAGYVAMGVLSSVSILQKFIAVAAKPLRGTSV